MPAMTPDLQREINKALCELLVNILEHASSSCGGLAIGQLPGTITKKKRIL